jgi:hypothetical protein
LHSAGNAQGCRLALAAANAKWSNHYVDKDTWPAVKASGLAPFGQCPFVHIQHPDGSSYVLAESHAVRMFVCWFVCCKFCLFFVCFFLKKRKTDYSPRFETVWI